MRRRYPPLPPEDCVAIGDLLMVVILNPSALLRMNSVKNLIISTESTIEILRLPPQNDITTQSPVGEGRGEGEEVSGATF